MPPAARVASDPLHATSADVSHLSPRPPVDAMAEFQHLLESEGLTASEAAAMVAVWRPALFDRPGRRALTLMTRKEYDQACPMTIRPAATRSVRVGVLWTEFPDDQPAVNK
jgi:hypothetical protein